MSLPSWERGLKFNTIGINADWIRSLPSWERGLKYLSVHRILNCISVAPLVGAWIEIPKKRLKVQAVLRRSPRGSVD